MLDHRANRYDVFRPRAYPEADVWAAFPVAQVEEAVGESIPA